MKTPEELYEKYEHLAKETVYRMFDNPTNIAAKNRIQLDDILQFAKTGLWIACTNFDSNKAKFKTHAINNIKWEVQTRLRRDTQFIRYTANEVPDKSITYKLVSTEEKVTVSDRDSSFTYHEYIPSEYNLLDEVEGNFALENILSVCNERDKQIILHRLNDKSSDEIGEMFGITGSRVRSIWKQIKKRLDNKDKVVIA
jgi:RNA polymerase sigma factor (sigma-70 family)